MDLVRRRDSDDSVEEVVRRDFPPGDGAYVQRRTTTRNRYPPRRRSAEYDYYDDDDRYESRRSAPKKSSRKQESRRYESDSESESRSPPRRRKSFSEQALAAIGLGGGAAAAAASSRKNRDKERDRDRDYEDRGDRNRRGRRYSDDDNYSHTRSKSADAKGFDQKQKIIQAAKAAVTAGAIEAWRSRKEPGGFAGQGKRVLTAAIGAAGIDGVIDRGEEHKTRHTIESALGGLAGNRLINGARQNSRSRSRVEEGKSDVGGIASAAGLAALAGQAFNNYRSKSRGRSEDRDGSPDGHRPRSRSVSEYISRGVDGAMAKLGLTQPKSENRGRQRDTRYDSEDDRDYRTRPRGGGAEEHETKSSSSSSSSSDTDSYDSDKEIKKQKKLKRRTLLTAGLASVATIHAVANVHGSMEKAKERHKKVVSGKMTEEESKRKQKKAFLQDAVAVGIAGIGIKSAFSELKELKEGREEYKHACQRFEEKRQHRRLKQSQPGDSHDGDGDQRRHSDDGPYYYDDNPYTAVNHYPPPPKTSRPYRDGDDYYR